MMKNTGPELHDRATRGEALSPEEQEQLGAWYEAMDRAEAEALGLGDEGPDESLAEKVDAALAKIAEVSHRIRRLDEQTRALRRENAALRFQLAQRTSTQRA